MSIPPFGSNGQWARARNVEGARSFLDEQQADADRHADAYERSALLRRKLRAKLHALFHRR